MARRRVLVDAGPLVALLSPRDEYHAACVAEFGKLPAPFITTWPVLAEAAWLLRDRPLAVEKLLLAGADGLFEIPAMPSSMGNWLAPFLRKYQNLPAQLADATLVYLAEHEGINTVFTLDRRDFLVYRFGKNKRFQILPEF